jgi:hypothetical protein
MLNALPNRIVLRRLTALLHCIVPRNEREPSDLMRCAMPEIDKPLESLVEDRRLKLEPKASNSTVESLAPNLAKLLTETLLPISAVPRTEIADPSRTKPRTLNELPHRKESRRLTAPSLFVPVKPVIDTPEPSRVKLLKLKQLPTSADKYTEQDFPSIFSERTDTVAPAKFMKSTTLNVLFTFTP